MKWGDLDAEAARLQQGVSVDLTRLLFDLWSALQEKADPAQLVATIDRRARLGAFEAFDAGARAQQSSLAPAQSHPDALLTAADTVARQRGTLVSSRALEVLKGYDEALVSPYARLAAQVLVTDSVRTGTRASGAYNGATRKEFVRIRPVQEPRAHSKLEGKILPIDDLFDIGGYLVFGPGDAKLPWSEKAHCGHILKFLK